MKFKVLQKVNLLTCFQNLLSLQKGIPSEAFAMTFLSEEQSAKRHNIQKKKRKFMANMQPYRHEKNLGFSFHLVLLEHNLTILMKISVRSNSFMMNFLSEEAAKWDTMYKSALRRIYDSFSILALWITILINILCQRLAKFWLQPFTFIIFVCFVYPFLSWQRIHYKGQDLHIFPILEMENSLKEKKLHLPHFLPQSNAFLATRNISSFWKIQV